MKQKVVIGLSGGVDSSVAAYLLKEQGYEVIALFMKNWHDDSVILDNECPWVEDSNDALMVAEQLKIPIHTVDFSIPYRARIVDYMFSEYRQGRTPNPDILCNREIKFDLFLKASLKLGADYIATGHYCRKTTFEGKDGLTFRLLSGKDKNKDQSYFLSQLNQYQIGKVLFPIGELEKSDVRKIAKSINLVTAEKKDSQGLCFIGKISLPKFLQQKLEPKQGDVVLIPADSPVFKKEMATAGHENDYTIGLPDLSRPFYFYPDMGRIIGQHNGAHYYTIGQRKGLEIGGFPEPLFIISTDTFNNIIYVGQGENHPGLYRKGLTVSAEAVHWIRPDLCLGPGEKMEVTARIRYRQPLEKATLHMETDRLYVIFDRPQRGVTPGQFVAWYLENEVLGSGVIH